MILFQTIPARAFARDGQTPPVESLGFPAPDFVWHCQTSSRRRSHSVHSRSLFVAAIFTVSFKVTKNPAYTG